jgi:gas vesicle protein
MKDDSGLNVIYFLAGLALGALGGILFAPRAGEEIRGDVLRRTNEGWEYLNEQADKIRDATEKMVQRSKEWMNRQSDAWRAEDENPGQEPKATI